MVESPEGELSLITAISTNDLTVSRSARTNAAENLASGDMLRKNPRFSVEAIDNAVDAVLQELSPRVDALLTEDVTYTVDDWYDVTDTAMEEVHTAWYIDDGNFYVAYFAFNTDIDNTQPKIFLASAGFTGAIHVAYTRPYAAITEMPNRLGPMMTMGAVYKLLGGSGARATSDIGRRTDRTVQGGQEHRDSYWFYREFVRLRDAERSYLDTRIKKLPRDRQSQRGRRFIR
jgi:hypothetical protein